MDKYLKRKRISEEEHGGNGNSGDELRHDAERESAPRKAKLRKYDPEYLQFGFIPYKDNSDQPQCVICLNVLSNESLKPAKLKRHLVTKHNELKDNPVDFFKRRAEVYANQQKIISTATTVNEKALKASYIMAMRIAKSKKAHTVAESLIMPAALEICEIMLGKESSRKLLSIPVSNDTIRRRICDMSNDIQLQLVERLQSSTFAIQLDESTDIAGQAQLLVYVRYCFDNDVVEDFLFCKPVPLRTTGEDLFAMLNDFFIANKLEWSSCIGICTDGAAAMTGHKSGVVARIRTVSPNIISTHCMIHREALASKNLNESFGEVLNTCIKLVNWIKCRPLNGRLFAALCEESGSDHRHLLLHTEVRWLSRGKVLQRVFELRSELASFLMDKNSELVKFVSDNVWLAKLAYLADIFCQLNALNTSLQGRDSSVLKTTDKITAFKKKLRIWKTRVQNKSYIFDHLSAMEEYFDRYFPTDNIADYDWIRNPFSCQLTNLTGKEEEQLAELSSDRSLKLKFQEQTLTAFWCNVRNEYTLLAERALTVLVPFATTYQCEASFSALAVIKSKFRSRLQVEDDIRVCLSKISPRIDLLCRQKQAHTSH
ncbi:SCAN domain-containing protein 3-like [Erpetoichthys calabaricus]|uniref:SCAN domain-containing protein 3-like n=1 Tax=Erpetoichthys calabaricus TaxID=27687 RepID=UPI00109F9B76|nr:SCAN domain-containing protein 3-like [Erpetoichthys calabaricus]